MSKSSADNEYAEGYRVGYEKAKKESEKQIFNLEAYILILEEFLQEEG